MVKTKFPMLEQRRIEANILKAIYAEMKRRLGEASAQDILGTAVINDSISQGQAYARVAEDTSLLGFAATLPQWTANQALEIEVIEQTSKKLHFNVVRCRYSEMYREMGLEHIGHLLSCNRDGTFCKGFNPDINFKRTQTIMEGKSHCDFRYDIDDDD